MAKVALSYGHGENTYREKHSKGVTVNGVQYSEHTHNAEVGTRVDRILKAHGVQTLIVQPPFGRDIPLSTRIANANKWGADLYWSFHSNAGDPDARGWCAFYWETSPEGKRAAQLYAKHVGALGLPLYSGDGIWGSVRGTWNAFQELEDTNMVAVLTENGFMTNFEDFKYIFLNKDNHWDKLAFANAKAILEYLRIKYDPIKSGESKVTTAKKEEPFVLEKAIVINSFADFPNAELLAVKTGAPIYIRSTVVNKKVAKELFVVGGNQDKLVADKFTVLSGADRFETAKKVNEYLK